MRRLPFIAAIAILLLLPFVSSAQGKYVIKGKVFNSAGEVIPGARINEQNTFKFASTDENGEFEYKATNEDAVILIYVEGCDIYKAKANSDFSKVVLYDAVEINRTWQIQLSFLNENLTAESDEYLFKNCTSNYGAGFTLGKTFYFKGKPGKKHTVRFGIVADWLNANYTNYTFADQFYNEVLNSTLTHINAGMQLGGVLTILPDKLFNIQLYAKYSPSYSLFNLKYSYGNIPYIGFTNGYTAGGNISVGCFGAGIEYTSHSGIYKMTEISGTNIPSKELRSPAIADFLNSEAITLLSGYRAYITFKF